MNVILAGFASLFVVLCVLLALIFLGFRIVLRIGNRRFVFCLPEKRAQVGATLVRRSINSANPGPSLPSLNLLTSPQPHQLDEVSIHEQASAIIQTLSEFGVPASIVEIHQGPRTTRFGVQPGFTEKVVRGEVQRRRVKVSAITSLANDLALALATQHLSIESPVPGKSYIGLEVPNRVSTVVALTSVLTSQTFTQIANKGGLPIALGSDVVGNSVAADLSSMPHLLIAGAKKSLRRKNTGANTMNINMETQRATHAHAKRHYLTLLALHPVRSPRRNHARHPADA